MGLFLLVTEMFDCISDVKEFIKVICYILLLYIIIITFLCIMSSGRNSGKLCRPRHAATGYKSSKGRNVSGLPTFVRPHDHRWHLKTVKIP